MWIIINLKTDVPLVRFSEITSLTVMGKKNVRLTVPPSSDWIPRNTFQGTLLYTFNALGGNIENEALRRNSNAANGYFQSKYSNITRFEYARFSSKTTGVCRFPERQTTQIFFPESVSGPEHVRKLLGIWCNIAVRPRPWILITVTVHFTPTFMIVIMRPV